jgi:hypothetical protein
MPKKNSDVKKKEELLQLIKGPGYFLKRKTPKRSYFMKNERVIKRLNFRLTCAMAPEQYDVFTKEGELVGYVRLRHDWLRCDYPTVGGEVIYSTHLKGNSEFSDRERYRYLNKIARLIKIKIFIEKLKKIFSKEN